MSTTLDGVGKLTGDLTAGCAAALQAVFGSLGKHLGPEDHRSIEQRQHDALVEALHRLIKADLLPESAGQATMAQVLIDFAGLRRMPGSSAAEREFIAARTGQPGRPGRLTGAGAEAEGCDALIAPMVTGSADWQAVDAIAEACVEAYGLDGHRQPCGCTCGWAMLHARHVCGGRGSAERRRLIKPMP